MGPAMPAASVTAEQLASFRALVGRLLSGGPSRGEELDACRAAVRGDLPAEARFEALCMVLEGALADPALPIDDTHAVVALLKALARGTVAAGDLL